MRFVNELLTFTDYFYATSDYERRRIRQHLKRQSFDKVPLLLGVPHYPYECIESTLFRAAEHNGLPGIAELCRALALPTRPVFNPKRLEQLADSLQMKKTELSRALPTVVDELDMKHWVDFGGHRLREEQLALSMTRICPRCVADCGHGRSYWALAPFAVCDAHGCALHDHCPACRCEFSLSRPAYMICQCGANLREYPGVFATPAAQQLCALLAARFRGVETLAKTAEYGFPEVHLHKLRLSELIDLVVFLGSLRSDPKVVLLRKLKGPVAISVALPAIERAARALTNWPFGFYAQMRQARAFLPGSESLRLVAKSLDHIVQLAITCMPQKELRFVTEEIARFLETPDEWNEQRKLFSQAQKAA